MTKTQAPKPTTVEGTVITDQAATKRHTLLSLTIAVIRFALIVVAVVCGALCAGVFYIAFPSKRAAMRAAAVNAAVNAGVL